MDIEKLYREYFTPVYRYTLSLVHDPDMAEEITQETFFRALKKINDYRGEASLKVWLCQIKTNGDEDPPHFARPERAVQRSLPAQDIRRPEFRRDR